MSATITYRRRINESLQVDLLVEMDPNGALRALELDGPTVAATTDAKARQDIAAGLEEILTSLRTFSTAGFLVRDALSVFEPRQREFVAVIADAQDYVMARDPLLAPFFSKGRAA